MNNAMTISILLLLSFLTSSCNEINQKQQKINNSRSLSNRTDTTQAPNGIVRTVKQDRRGNIWIASWKGVFRYDGKSFTNITADVSTARFFAVLEDKKGNFWLTSIGSGVYYYDGKSSRNFTTKDGLAGNQVTEIYADKAGHIWFCTDAGASRYDGKSFKNFTAKDGLSNNSVNSIMEDKTGKLWFGTSDDACVYDGRTYTVLKHEGKSFKNVRSIIADKNGNIWTSSDSIVNRDFKHVSQPPTKTKSWILSRYNSKSLSDSSTPPEIIRSGEALIFGITEANDGSIWFGTSNGVYRYDGDRFTDFKTR